ncbi:transposase [Streptomyces anulatus]|uniref:transposase n=1 Tax=Streptomyces anulatus TaxID=1892 RepID=UPI00364A33B2
MAPATRNSGSSIRGEQPSWRGNKQLKRTFFLSAFAAMGTRHPGPTPSSSEATSLAASLPRWLAAQARQPPEPFQWPLEA